MENFMDKLAEKIGTRDIIKANAQAEAMEAERTRQEAEQYKIQLEQLKAGETEHKKAIDEMGKTLEDLTKRMDDSDTKVHDVGVQVYRNVQAIVEKGQDKEFEELESLKKKLEKSEEEFKELSNKLETILVGVDTGNSGVKPLLVITMLIAAADLVINILRILGII
jgi:predicted RNase H-like nuclease (RuvC/YqgF family)